MECLPYTRHCSVLWKSPPCVSWSFLTPGGSWRPIYSVSYWTHALRNPNCSCVLGYHEANWDDHTSSAGPRWTCGSWVGPHCSTYYPPLPPTESSFLLPSESLLPESFHPHHFFSIPSGISYQLPSLLLGNFFLAPWWPPWIYFPRCHETYFLKCTPDLVSLV